MRAGLALAAAALAGIGPGAIAATPPEARHGNVVEIVNDTPFTILHFYAHEEGMADWTEDWLGELVIEPGKSLKMDFDAGPNRCRYDIRIEFIDGDDFNLARFDACAETVLRVSVG